MFRTFIQGVKGNKSAVFVGIILFIIPFFWLTPGEMDLGGDDNRLFFYDPITYLKSTNLYAFRIEGMGMVESRYFEIPYILLIAFLKFFSSSSTFAISFINGLKLGVAFLAVYFTVYEFIKQIYSGNKTVVGAALMAGLFYVVVSGSLRMEAEWNRALTSHNQIFLNPLLFYFIFKFFQTNIYRYLWITIFITFFFSTSFSYTAVVSIFAFYPLAIIFLILYTRLYLKKPIPWKGIVIGFILLLGVHSFHALGQFSSFFDEKNEINAGVFNKTQHSGVDFFSALAPQGMATLSLLVPSSNTIFRLLSFIPPFIVLVGFLLNRKKEFLFISVFFLVTFFLVTANITDLGLLSYKNMFYLPAFSMFRYFYSKWMYIFLLFYTILFGLSFYLVQLKLKPFYSKWFFYVVFISFIFVGLPIFSGRLVNANIVRGSDNLSTVVTMDPQFEEALSFIRNLPDDGKFLILPLTDFNYQIFRGENGGAYEGAPAIRHLSLKYGFYGDRNFGWQDIDPVKYTELIKKYAGEKDYNSLFKIFTSLNIRYIFHNSDSKIYESNFKRFEGLFTYIKSSFPETQAEYKDFIMHFPVKIVYKNGPYTIYEVDKPFYNPTVFIPDIIYQSNLLSLEAKNHSVFISNIYCRQKEFKKLCSNYEAPKINVKFTMVNPTSYKITIHRQNPSDPFLIVLQHTYNPGWKLIYNNERIAEDKHIIVNGYANGWYIVRDDIPKSNQFALYIQLENQKYFKLGWIITGLSLGILLLLFLSSFIRKK